MPVIKSSIKAVRQNKKRRALNLIKKQTLKKEIVLIKKGKSKDLKKLYSLADRAAKAGTIHLRKAARLKSRLSKMLKA